MTTVFQRRALAVFLAIFAALIAGQAGAQAPEFVDLVKPFLKADANTEWDAVETLPGVKWAPLPPKELSDCLPTGDCYVRQGIGVGGRPKHGRDRRRRADLRELALSAQRRRGARRARGARVAEEERPRRGAGTLPDPSRGGQHQLVPGEGRGPFDRRAVDPDARAPASRARASSSPGATRCPRSSPTSSRTTASSARPARNAHPCRPRSRTRCSRRRWLHSCRRPTDRRSTTGRRCWRYPPGSPGTERRRSPWT